DLIIGLPPLREKFDAAISDSPDPVLTSNLFQAQSRISTALLAHNPSAAELAAQSMRAQPISDPKLRQAVDGYAEAIIAIAIRTRRARLRCGRLPSSGWRKRATESCSKPPSTGFTSPRPAATCSTPTRRWRA